MKARILWASLLIAGLAGCSSGGKQFLYTTGPGTPEVFQFRMHSNGSLTALSQPNASVGPNPVSVVIHPSGDFAYIADFGGNSVTLLTVNRGNGELTVPPNPSPIPPPTPANVFNTGTGPIAMAAAPAGGFLYVLNQGSSNITAFTVDPTTGSLGAVAGSPFALPCSGSSIAITPKGDALFVTCPTAGTLEALTIDSHGVLSAPTVASSGGSPTFATVDPTGHFLYYADAVNNNVVGFTVGSNGSLTLLPAAGAAGLQPVALATDPQGALLFVANKGSNNVSVFVIDSKTGALGAVAGSPFPTGGRGPNFLAATGTFLYVTDQLTNDVAALAIGTNGALTPVTGSPFNVATQPVWVALGNF